jgi:hypothetical protein
LNVCESYDNCRLIVGGSAGIKYTKKAGRGWGRHATDKAILNTCTIFSGGICLIHRRLMGYLILFKPS